MTEEFQIPQIDGNADGEAHYELKIETHDDCTHNEIVEAMEANFFGTIDDKKIEDSDYLKSWIIQHLKKESLLENEKRKVVNYRIAVKENDSVRRIIRSWQGRYNFDELAFKNYDYENRNIRILDVLRV